MQSIPMVFILGMVAVNVVQAVRVSHTMCFFPRTQSQARLVLSVCGMCVVPPLPLQALRKRLRTGGESTAAPTSAHLRK